MGAWESLNPTTGRSAGSVAQIEQFFAQQRAEREDQDRMDRIRKMMTVREQTPESAARNTMQDNIPVDTSRRQLPPLNLPPNRQTQGNGLPNNNPAMDGPAAPPLDLPPSFAAHGGESAGGGIFSPTPGRVQMAPDTNTEVRTMQTRTKQPGELNDADMLALMDAGGAKPGDVLGWVMSEKAAERKAQAERAGKAYDNQLGIQRDAARVAGEGTNEAARDERVMNREMVVALAKSGMKPEDVSVSDVPIDDESGQPVMHKIAVSKKDGRIVWNTSMGVKHEKGTADNQLPEDFIITNENGFPIGVDKRTNAKQKQQISTHLDSQEASWNTRLQHAQAQMGFYGEGNPKRTPWEQDVQTARTKLQMIDNVRTALRNPIDPTKDAAKPTAGAQPAAGQAVSMQAGPAQAAPAQAAPAKPAAVQPKVYIDKKTGHKIQYNEVTKTWDTVK